MLYALVRLADLHGAHLEVCGLGESERASPIVRLRAVTLPDGRTLTLPGDQDVVIAGAERELTLGELDRRAAGMSSLQPVSRIGWDYPDTLTFTAADLGVSDQQAARQLNQLERRQGQLALEITCTLADRHRRANGLRQVQVRPSQLLMCVTSDPDGDERAHRTLVDQLHALEIGEAVRRGETLTVTAAGAQLERDPLPYTSP